MNGNTILYGAAALLSAGVALSPLGVLALELDCLWRDGRVLSAAHETAVTGVGAPKATVTVSLGGRSYRAAAGEDGRFAVTLPAQGVIRTPFEVVVSDGTGEVRVRDCLSGLVLLAGGQSNMEVPVKEALDWEREAAAANRPQIREFKVEHDFDFAPRTTLKGSWTAVSPKSAPAIGAIGYYTARRLQDELDGIPVGIINNSYSASPIEPWLPLELLRARYPRYLGLYDKFLPLGREGVIRRRAELGRTFLHQDGRNEGEEKGWHKTALEDGKDVKMPNWLDYTAYSGDSDGAFWVARSFELPPEFVGKELEFRATAIDDYDITYLNGVKIGATGEETPDSYDKPRAYRIPANLVKPGRNVIVIRIFDTAHAGGMPPDGKVCLAFGEKEFSLAGVWKTKPEKVLKSRQWPADYLPLMKIYRVGSVLYNAMFAPLKGTKVDAILWYQGESNAGDRNYGDMFRDLIVRWRQELESEDAPFVYMQLAAFQGPPKDAADTGSWPGTREQQEKALELPFVRQVPTIDIGDANRIHPLNKQEVGRRAALWLLQDFFATNRFARTIAFPALDRIERTAGGFLLHFRDAEGMKTTDGRPPATFVVAGRQDPKTRRTPAAYVPARISGESVEVFLPRLDFDPVEIRYAWFMNPEVNTVNALGFPMLPFRIELPAERPADAIGGKWITAMAGQGNYRPALRFSKAFVARRPVAKATLAATALGLYVPYVNGRTFTERRMLPGWTQYERRVPSQTFDVTGLVRPGTNVVSALVGNGWYCGQMSYVAWAGLNGERTGWGRHPRFRAELTLTYDDGSVETIATDRTWSSFYMDPATLSNDIYQGEEYDAEIDDTAWKSVDCITRSSLNSVTEVDEPTVIVGDVGQPVEVTRELKPVKVERRPSGTWLLDFGENIAGVDRIRLKKAHPGAVIVVRHGEDLDAQGNLWRANLAFAGAKTVLTCGYQAPFEYVPNFTFYGYRYAEVSGWPADEEMTADSVTALVISSAVRQTGTFECSNELVNRLFANVLRSQQGNFIDVPTDCPQRCERFGWTGDAQIFAETAMMNYDVSRFFSKWIVDLRLCVDANGAFPSIAPWPDTGYATVRSSGSAGWSDAGVVCPWMLFRKYGDLDSLKAAYPSIARYARTLVAAQKLGTIGDHLNLDQPTSADYVAEALRIEMLRLAGLAADAVGRADDAWLFAWQRERLLKEFRAQHFDAEGLPRERTQTAAAFSLAYGLYDGASARRKTVARLKELIAERGGHLATGFLGTPVLLKALTEAGELEAAYALLEQKTHPSWLYPVTQGATTIWERWNAKVDGTYHSNWMNSLNHYAYGSVAAWFYDTIAGIRDLTEENPKWAAFRRFRLAPQPGGTLTSARATHKVPSGGMIVSDWKLADGKLVWKFEVPAGTVAEIVWPGRLDGALPTGVTEANGVILAKPGRYEVICLRP